MKRNYYIVALIMLTFFVISFITNIFGPITPEIKKGFNLNYVLTAVLYFAFFIAYGVMSIPAGMLIEKYNEKKMMTVAFIVAFAGSLLFAWYPNYSAALPSLFIIGGGFAILQVVINPLLRTAGARTGRPPAAQSPRARRRCTGSRPRARRGRRPAGRC